MKSESKILSGIILILVIVCVGLGVALTNTRENIGVKERTLNEQHQRNISTYNSAIETLDLKVVTLESEIKDLKDAEPEIRFKTINTIDSIARLSFGGKGLFFTESIAYADSIRSRYLSVNND